MLLLKWGLSYTCIIKKLLYIVSISVVSSHKISCAFLMLEASHSSFIKLYKEINIVCSANDKRANKSVCHYSCTKTPLELCGRPDSCHYILLLQKHTYTMPPRPDKLWSPTAFPAPSGPTHRPHTHHAPTYPSLKPEVRSTWAIKTHM